MEGKAIDFCEKNANLVNRDSDGVKTTQMIAKQLNWYEPQEILDHNGKEYTYDLIVGSDIIYLSTAIAPICKIIKQKLVHDGVAMIVDPGRHNNDEFSCVATDHGFSLSTFVIPRLQCKMETNSRLPPFTVFVITNGINGKEVKIECPLATRLKNVLANIISQRTLNDKDSLNDSLYTSGANCYVANI